jgi:hypothetical protein
MKIAFPTLLLAAFTGCVTSPMPYPGGLYSDVTGPNRALEGKVAVSKRGESCANSVLGLVAWGDASIDSAARQGGIGRIAAVDYKNHNVLAFVYTKTCVLVSGS